VRLLSRLFWIAIALAAAHAAVGIGMSFVGNLDGWLGGVMYALMFALPLVLIAFGLRSPKQRTRVGWAALVLAVLYGAVVIGNWSGYPTQQAVFAVAITGPTVALDLVIFWATVLHRPRRSEPVTPMTS
jgi:uncharacterized membrane protein